MAKSRFAGNSSTNRGAIGNPHGKAVDKGSSQRSFTEHAAKTHFKNMPTRLPMRGGIRL